MVYYFKEHRGVDNLKAIGVVEFQDKNRYGVIHYHLLINHYIHWEILEALWRNRRLHIDEKGSWHFGKVRTVESGYVSINQVDSIDNLGRYLSSYLKKSTDDIRLDSKKAIIRWGRLEKPEEITDPVKIYEIFKSKGITNLNKLYTFEKDIEEINNKLIQTEYNMNHQFLKNKKEGFPKRNIRRKWYRKDD